MNDHQYDLKNVGRNRDDINTSVAVTNEDTKFSFKATPNNDQPYIRNQETVTKKSYLSLQKLGKDLFSCVSNSQSYSKAVFFTMKQWMEYFKRGVDVEVRVVRLDNNTNVIDTHS